MNELKTIHKIIVANSANMAEIEDQSVQLIVTSPPYPMIEMWDELFSNQDKLIPIDINEGRGYEAFEKMHNILDNVWKECDRVLENNGFICVNIGDATRTINGEFCLYSNHSRIIKFFQSLGYSVLPDIHWRKQSNAPNKFMGSGMYPAGAYVTYEHEYILVFRKGGKRIFTGNDKVRRQKSAYFWEERNVWFSDLWDLKGTSQNIKNSKANRERSAAYPFEVPYRLVNMYSVEGDTVLDPFAGLGTTSLACMTAQRNSIGVEISPDIAQIATENLNVRVDKLNKIIDSRVNRHNEFIASLSLEKLEKCYKNETCGFLVKTKQEMAIDIKKIKKIHVSDDSITCEYE